MTTNLHEQTLVQRRGTVCHVFMEQYGFDPFAIFCSVTGKRIATSEGMEVLELIDSLPGDPDEVADDIALRLFASMRPSMHWNKMREESLDVLRKTRPLEVLAYLLNRAFAPVTGGNLLVLNHDKIRLFQQLSAWGWSDSLNTMTYYLLEIDAKIGLHTDSPSFTVEDFTTRFESMDLLLSLVEAYYSKRLDDYAKFVKQQEMNTRYFRSGNALAKGAFFTAFMESKPPTQKELKDKAKKEEKDFFTGLLAEVLGTPKTDAEQEAVTPKPIRIPGTTKMPKWGAKA